MMLEMMHYFKILFFDTPEVRTKSVLITLSSQNQCYNMCCPVKGRPTYSITVLVLGDGIMASRQCDCPGCNSHSSQKQERPRHQPERGRRRLFLLAGIGFPSSVVMWCPQ